MRIAALADVHSNEPALLAVLEAIHQQSPDLVLFLGDLVGYNASPNECVNLVRSACDVVVLGNHDRDVGQQEPISGTNSVARIVQDWTRDVLSSTSKQYLNELPPLWSDGNLNAVHGCFLNDRYYCGYVTGTMLDYNLQALSTWSKADEHAPIIGFCGHTHIPMLGFLAAERYVEPQVRGVLQWPRTAVSVLINPGSVGQPRDGDQRAAFAIIDTERREVEVHRVDYDVERACAAITAAGLPISLSERLREGR